MMTMPSTTRMRHGMAPRADFAVVFLLPADLNFAIETWRLPRSEKSDSSSVDRISRALLRPAREQHHFGGVKHDQRIQRRSEILNVVQIIFQLDDRVLNAVAVLMIDLRPSRDPRPDAMPLAVI